MREQAGLAIIQKCAQIHAGVPVGREIIDSTFRQDSLKTESLLEIKTLPFKEKDYPFMIISKQLNTTTAKFPRVNCARINHNARAYNIYV